MSSFRDLSVYVFEGIKGREGINVHHVREVLRWLDENQEMAPTPTITRSAFKNARELAYEDVGDFLGAMRCEDFLHRLGIEVEPEATNVEKWAKFLRQVHPASIMIDDYAKAIDNAGIKAPEATDE